MDGAEVLKTPQGRQIAVRRRPGRGPGVMFLGGFRSEMTATKATGLDAWAAAAGRAFLRFDYSGHGISPGDVGEGCIGDWAADALAVLDALTGGPQVLVGSSMGGWIALLLARARPGRVAGLVGIAAAPDFTEDGWWAGFDAAQRGELMAGGVVELPSAYGPGPLRVTRRVIEDGRRHLVLRAPLAAPFPVRLLHGSADAEVPLDRGLRLLAHIEGPDVRLTVVRGADHRFSDPACLALLTRTVEEIAP